MPEGLVNLVPVRVLPNLKAGTVEEARKRKKTTHLTAFCFLIEELRNQLKLINKGRPRHRSTGPLSNLRRMRTWN